MTVLFVDAASPLAADSDLEVLQAEPVSGRDAPGRGRTLILLHGLSHGAWCWRHFLPYFAARGYRVLAPSLRGHGGSPGRAQLDRFGLEDYVADLAALVRRQAEPPIVIGHSMGGVLLQLYLQQHARSLQAAVLLASMPPRGMLWTDLALLPLRGFSGMRSYARLAQGRAVSARQVASMPFFSHRLDAETAQWLVSRLQPESRRAVDELKRFSIAAPPSWLPPLLTVGSAGDWLFGRRAVRLTAEFYGSERIVFEQPCHDLMLDPQWRACAEAIDAWLACIH